MQKKNQKLQEKNLGREGLRLKLKKNQTVQNLG